MAFSVSFIYKVIDEASATLGKIAATTELTTRKMNHAIEEIGRGSFSQLGRNFQDFGAKMSVGFTLPIVAAGVGALKSAANFEQLEIAFGTMLKSGEKGRQFLGELTQFAAKTPFELPGITSAGRQLLAAKVPVDQITQRLEFLGNIAAGTAQPIEELAALYAKVQSKGKAQAEELFQAAERGIPILQALQKGLKLKNTQQVLDLASKGKISADIFDKALRSLGTGAGDFAGLMEKQSQSLSGIFSTLMDTLRLFGADIGNVVVATFDLKTVMTNLIDGLAAAASWFKGIAKESPGLAKAMILTAVFLAGIGPALIGLGTALRVLSFAGPGLSLLFPIFSLLYRGIGLLTVAIRVLSVGAVSAFRAIGAAMLTTPIGLIITAILAVAAIAYVLYKNWDKVLSWFSAKWAAVTSAFNEGFFSGIWTALKEFNPLTVFVEAINGLIEYLFGVDLLAIASKWLSNLPLAIVLISFKILSVVEKWVSGFVATILSVDLLAVGLEWLSGLVKSIVGLDLYNTGVNLINTFWTGLKDQFAELIGWVAEAAGKIAGFFGGDKLAVAGSAGGRIGRQIAPPAAVNSQSLANVAEASNPARSTEIGQPRPAEIPSGMVDVNINLTGQTQQVQSVKTRAVGKGNLGVNMVRSGPGL